MCNTVGTRAEVETGDPQHLQTKSSAECAIQDSRLNWLPGEGFLFWKAPYPVSLPKPSSGFAYFQFNACSWFQSDDHEPQPAAPTSLRDFLPVQKQCMPPNVELLTLCHVCVVPRFS